MNSALIKIRVSSDVSNFNYRDLRGSNCFKVVKCLSNH